MLICVRYGQGATASPVRWTLTMDAELLQAKIERLEAGGGGGPLGLRRSKR